MPCELVEFSVIATVVLIGIGVAAIGAATSYTPKPAGRPLGRAAADPARDPGTGPGAQRPPGPQVHTLAERVRELKAAGRIEQAMFLVRGETGMGYAEAAVFVQSIQHERDAE
ncbi:hypothetical protein [Spongiactinospora sp. TRM90649]|uniref:hypothetical protein n=1 Tax=Spongiactinospora sp. TRM90649 TaxID=3031114 RepID=UPI0023F9CB1D|nr:hypothetical protein [Spongiactinospora sp. TRM90649]MDF5756701.1 hypothetical protein [Spongiactinospora sp. TRM90649]